MTTRRIASAALLCACAAGWGCGEDPVAPELVGWFSLSTIDGETLPAPLPCASGHSVLSSLLYLGSDRSAGYTFTYRTAAGDTVTFEGNGTFEESAATVAAVLAGQWSTGEDEVLHIDFERVGQALRKRLGTACDAAAAAEYLPALVSSSPRNRA